MKLKLILFDLDGVLVDTEYHHHDCLLRAIDETYPGIPRSLIDGTITFDGSSTQDKIARLHERLNPERYSRYGFTNLIDPVKQRYTLEALKTVRPDPDITELLEWLKGLGYKMGVGTNTRLVNAVFILDRMGISEFFDIVVVGDSGFARKPSPDIFKTAMSAIEVDPTETLIVEDSEMGRLAALASGAYLYEVTNRDDLNIKGLLHGISEADHSRANGRTGCTVRRARLYHDQAADRG